MRVQIIITLSLILVLVNCNTSKVVKYRERSCVSDWVYQDLKYTIHVQKIYYQRGYKYSLFFSPSFLVGKDSSGKLMGFVSYKWSDTGLSDSVIVDPFYWPRDFTTYSKPDLSVVINENALLDSLVCRLDTIYRCKW